MSSKAPSDSVSGPSLAEGTPSDDGFRSLVGQTVAERYHVQELLGVGGMGCVYRARHIHIKKQVAFKTLNAIMLRSPEAVARFEREAVAAARIDHPNVVVATDFGRLSDGRYYLVLEFVEGRNLRAEIDLRGSLTVPHALAIGQQIASALAAAHQLGIVHRDLKPENVMLVKRGADVDLVKVLDFGIAKMTLEDQSQPLTQLGAVFGTPQYMSPEQAGGRAVDGRSDLYALGIILYEMLTGKLPFDAADALGFIVQQLSVPPLPLPAQVPEPLRKLVESLLEKAPENRPSSATCVQAELERLAPLLGRSVLVNARPVSIRPPDWVRNFALSLGSFFAQPRRVGRVVLPTAIWLLVPGCLLVALVFVLNRGRSADNSSRPADLNLSSIAQVSSSILPELSNAESAREVERIEQIRSYQRSERDWMLLARGSARLSRFEQSALAYQALLSLKGSLRKDAGLLQDLLEDSQDPKAFRLVLNLAEVVLGRHGVDLIWSMWDEQRRDPERKEQTDKLAKKLVILSHSASPAVRVAIELTFTTQCEKLLAVLGRAVNDADSRSIERLSALSTKTGCGSSKSDDCYPCLRNGDLLAQATERARRTRAPGLGKTTEE